MSKRIGKIFVLLAALQPTLSMARVIDHEREYMSAKEKTIPSLTFGLKPSLIIGSMTGGALSFGAHGEKHLSENLSLGARADYWSVGGSFVNVSDLSLGGFAKYSFNTADSKLKPYLSAGLATHILSISTPFGGTSQAAFGLDLGAGCRYEFMPEWSVDASLELRQISEALYLQMGVGLTKSI